MCKQKCLTEDRLWKLVWICDILMFFPNAYLLLFVKEGTDITESDPSNVLHNLAVDAAIIIFFGYFLIFVKMLTLSLDWIRNGKTFQYNPFIKLVHASTVITMLLPALILMHWNILLVYAVYSAVIGAGECVLILTEKHEESERTLLINPEMV